MPDSERLKVSAGRRTPRASGFLTWRYVFAVIVLVFLAEAGVMLLLPAAVPDLGVMPTALVDASVLILLVVPVLILIERRRQHAEGRARLLAAVVEHADDIIVGLAPDATIRSWNAAAERQTGFTAEEAIGRQGTLMVPEDRRAEVAPLLERVSRGEVVSRHQTVVVRKDGTAFDTSVTAAPLRDERGRIMGIAAVARDVSERKRFEAAQAELIRRLEAALEDVKQLRGLLHVCASCKRIKEETGSWTQMEAYVRRHSDAEFSHGLCPACAKKLYDVDVVDETSGPGE